MKSFTAFALLVGVGILSSASAFAPMKTSTLSTTTSSTRSFVGTSQRSLMVTPDNLDGLQNLDHDALLSQIQHTTSLLLSDAAAAAADSSADSGGWWNAYLNIFKTTIEGLHGVIDAPLQSVGITQTWGLSIGLFTALVRSALIPLSLQQSKSSEYVKALKPKMDEIKEKFKDNKDMQNRAIAKLYEDANQNPLAGCFVSLAQLPIFLGLYRGIRLLAVEGKLEEPFLWIPSLQGPVTAESDYRGLDWLTQGWSMVDGSLSPSLGWETTIAFLIMPVILVLGQSLSMSVLAPPVDENMPEEEKEQFEKTQRILKFLPLLIGFFSLQVPAGLTIYWFTSNLFTVTQSLVVRKYYELNPPSIELPDYWEALDDVANMSADEKRQAAEAGLAVGPKYADLLQEAKFHVVVDRQERLRKETSSSSSGSIPPELQSWVGSTSTVEAEATAA